MKFLACAQKIQKDLTNAGCPVAETSTDRRDDWSNTSHVALYLAADHASVKDYLIQHSNASIHTIRDLHIQHVDDTKRRGRRDPDDNGDMMAWGEFQLLQSSTCIVQSHSKYSTVAGILSQYGCAVYYDDCSDDTVRQAVNKVALNHTRLHCM